MFDTTYDKNILNPKWPQITWHIAGLCVHQHLLKTVTDTLSAAHLHHRLGAFHGSPNLVWNDSRVNCGPLPLQDAARHFKALNTLGIGVFLTFSNPILKTKHLADTDANRLLDCLDEQCGLNGVVVASDLLSDHIRQKKPQLLQICASTKSVMENEHGSVEWYQEMQNRFDRVAVHADHAFNPELLSRLDPLTAQIQVNNRCIYACPHQKRHLTLNAAFNMAVEENSKAAGDILKKIIRLKQQTCARGAMLLSRHRNPAHARSCFLNHDEIKAIYDMGFRHFCITGNRQPASVLVWDLIHCIFAPGFGALLSAPLTREIDQQARNRFQRMKNVHRNPAQPTPASKNQSATRPEK